VALIFFWYSQFLSLSSGWRPPFLLESSQETLSHSALNTHTHKHTHTDSVWDQCLVPPPVGAQPSSEWHSASSSHSHHCHSHSPCALSLPSQISVKGEGIWGSQRRRGGNRGGDWEAAGAIRGGVEGRGTFRRGEEEKTAEGEGKSVSKVLGSNGGDGQYMQP
jgi:hypothetical protein